MVALCVLAFASPAAAFPSTRLVYVRAQGAEQCPEQNAMRKAVSTRLGYDPFFASSDKTVIVRVLRQADHLTGQVELIDEHGVQVGLREFSAEPDHCGDLIRAMALSISIAIDPKSAETYSQGPADEPPESSSEPLQPAKATRVGTHFAAGARRKRAPAHELSRPSSHAPTLAGTHQAGPLRLARGAALRSLRSVQDCSACCAGRLGPWHWRAVRIFRLPISGTTYRCALRRSY